ncbi:DUF4232 domain-containing protein [Streptomyces smyrnaeus]|uniref:DUF4232 domain-containing protein n=1 Tax=Streptomyces TaxID=1883 RepID=UPI0015D4DFEA|nr:DUF4232 domain-containing protein [Streptomyces sp. RK75]MBQ0863643.1 DUF4232 domain-containing protein [Streptomyces sp. RK75]MBQ1158223.1 DUF4232 domain-containing protein [Streptomyces sp. A73]
MTRRQTIATDGAGSAATLSWRRRTAAVGAAVLLAATAACSSGDDGSDDGSGAQASGAREASPSASPDDKKNADAGGTPRCAAADLTMAVEHSRGTADGQDYDLTLKNKTDSACLLNGHPRVFLADEDGDTIGEAAAPEGRAGETVTLQPLTRAHATLHTADEGGDDGTGDGSCWTTPHSLRVYPPGSGKALVAESDQPRVCGGLFTVTALKW